MDVFPQWAMQKQKGKKKKKEAIMFTEYLLRAKCLGLGIRCLSSLNTNTLSGRYCHLFIDETEAQTS